MGLAFHHMYVQKTQMKNNLMENLGGVSVCALLNDLSFKSGNVIFQRTGPNAHQGERANASLLLKTI